MGVLGLMTRYRMRNQEESKEKKGRRERKKERGGFGRGKVRQRWRDIAFHLKGELSQGKG